MRLLPATANPATAHSPANIPDAPITILHLVFRLSELICATEILLTSRCAALKVFFNFSAARSAGMPQQ
jgi:hypothetical protein